MEFPETVRLAAETKVQLATLKKRTGIQHWNTLCRWGFCLSISDSSPIRDRTETSVGAIEMTWKTFAGDEEEVYRNLLIERCEREFGSTDRETLTKALRWHIARGIARLMSNRELKSLADLIELAVANNKTSTAAA
jgi:DNA sulfur modification protein DndE